MTDLTRRAFVKQSAGAAAGATVVGALLAEPAMAHGHSRTAHHVGESLPIVAYVSNARRGEVTLMTADREVRVRDRALAARIVRAAR